MHAANFSRQEIEIIRSMVMGGFDMQKDDALSQREWDEFCKKIGK